MLINKILVLYVHVCKLLTEYSYERLDGSVRGEERFLAVKKFTEDDDIFVFLISTRAGQWLCM